MIRVSNIPTPRQTECYVEASRGGTDKKLLLGWQQLAYAVAQSIGCDDEENFVAGVAVILNREGARRVFLETIRFELSQRCLDVVDLEETPILTGIAPIFCQPYLYSISRQDSGLVRGITTRHHLKPHHRFVEGDGLLHAFNRQVHIVALVTPGRLKRCFHCLIT